MRNTLHAIIAAAALLAPAYAQNYEFSAFGGASFYHTKTVANPRGTAEAGFSPGWGAGASIGHNMYSRVGGEIRYQFLQNGLKLSSGSTTAKFGAQSHTVHYDVLIHTASRESAIRPYVAVGGGMRQYRGTGTEVAVQPLSSLALLTKTQEIVGVVSVGAGLKFQITPNMYFRVDVHDYLSPFPKKVITPTANSRIEGWINNIVPMAGVSFTF